MSASEPRRRQRRLLGQVGHGDAGLREQLAAVQLDQPGQDAQQGRLAGAVAADQADPVALGQHRVEPGEQLLLADPQAGVLEGEEWWGHVRAIGDAVGVSGTAAHARPRRA